MLFVLLCFHVLDIVCNCPYFIYLIKRYCEVVLSVTSVLNKACCELNLSDSVDLAVTHEIINFYVRYRIYTYPLEKSWLFVYVFLLRC